MLRSRDYEEYLSSLDYLSRIILFIALDNNPKENERVERIINLPRFQAKYPSEPIVYAISDFIYFQIYGEIEEVICNADAVVCMNGVLQQERMLMSDLHRICAGWGIQMYFEDILELELGKKVI